MDILKRAVQIELERIENGIQEYELELEKLPNGYLSKKTINGKVYYYLQNREKENRIMYLQNLLLNYLHLLLHIFW